MCILRRYQRNVNCVYRTHTFMYVRSTYQGCSYKNIQGDTYTYFVPNSKELSCVRLHWKDMLGTQNNIVKHVSTYIRLCVESITDYSQIIYKLR